VGDSPPRAPSLTPVHRRPRADAPFHGHPSIHPFIHSFQSINRSPSSQRSFVRVRSSPVLVAVVGFVNPSNAASRRRRRPIASHRIASHRARDDDTDHTHLVDDSRAHRIDNQSTRIARARCVTHHPSSRSIDPSIDPSIESVDRSIDRSLRVHRSIDRVDPSSVLDPSRSRSSPAVVASSRLSFFLKFTSRDPSPWTRSIESPIDRRVATDRSTDRSIESPPRRPTPRPPRGREVTPMNAPRNGVREKMPARMRDSRAREGGGRTNGRTLPGGERRTRVRARREGLARSTSFEDGRVGRGRRTRTTTTGADPRD
jgi:hypothetical protein